jgi:hypothetical protein
VLEHTANTAAAAAVAVAYIFSGERLWLVGDGDALGNWDAAKAANLCLNTQQTLLLLLLLLQTCCVFSGERLWLVGDGDALGNGDASKAVETRF